MGRVRRISASVSLSASRWDRHFLPTEPLKPPRFPARSTPGRWQRILPGAPERSRFCAFRQPFSGVLAGHPARQRPHHTTRQAGPSGADRPTVEGDSRPETVRPNCQTPANGLSSRGPWASVRVNGTEAAAGDVEVLRAGVGTADAHRLVGRFRITRRTDVRPGGQAPAAELTFRAPGPVPCPARGYAR